MVIPHHHVLTLTTGTLFLMWLGDQITDRGIGNGISLIITIGIVARLPAALAQAWKTFVPSAQTGTSQVNPAILVLMVAFLFIVIAAVIAVTQGVRKITVQYAKRVVGRKMYGGQTQYMPLKVNYAGVMPIIFAWALLLFPTTIVGLAFKNSRTAKQIADMLSNGWLHYVVLAAMIFFFSYFWVATQFQPAQIADDLKKYGGYIPGVRPGKPTADFLDFTMTRLTFAGAIFLTLIAILPSLLSQGLHVPAITAQFFGGTSLLIIVGVILDTMRQVETHLIQRHYDGFLRKGRIRGRAFRSLRLQSGRGGAAGNFNVALRRHRCSGNRRRGNFSLRTLGEKSNCASRRAGFRKGNTGGDDYAAFRDPVTSPGTILRRERDLGTPLGLETDEISKHGGSGSRRDYCSADRRLADAARQGRVRLRWISAHSPARRSGCTKFCKSVGTAARSRHLAGGFRSRRCAIGSRAGCNVGAAASRPA